ncbi:MAG: hypothetical protein ACREMG_13905 [Gemmatimonadales bacterium]
MGYRVWRIWAVALALAPARLTGQLAPVGVPAGAVRFEVDGALESWDTRYRDGEKEPLGTDLTSPSLGGALLPGLTDAEARIARIIGAPSYSFDLGSLRSDAQADVSTAVLGLSLGLTNSITIFGRLPLVRARVQTATTLDSASANAGPNPGALSQGTFFTELEAALSDLRANLAAGDYDADPALAQATLADGSGLRDDLFGLLSDPMSASAFVPLAASTAGTALTARIEALRSTLGSLGVSGFTATPVLPTERVTEDELVAFLEDPVGPFAGRPGDSEVTFRGDAEAGVGLTLVDHWDRGAHRGGFRTAVEALVRFPTGLRERTDRPIALGTGDGQTDVEVRIATDLGGGAWGARLEAGYNRQLAADLVDRVAPPSQPFVGVDRLANLRRDPGDLYTISGRPFLRLARTLALIGTVAYWNRGEDAVEYRSPADAIPGVDANILGEESEASATVVGIGLTYANPGRLRPGGQGLPVDASWSYERVVSASGGRVANTHRVRASLRLYIGLF